MTVNGRQLLLAGSDSEVGSIVPPDCNPQTLKGGMCKFTTNAMSSWLPTV
jgi:hypothetical protein